MIVSPHLDEDSPITVLEMPDGQIRVALTPALADHLDLHPQQNLTAQDFRRKLNEADVQLHGADYLFYFLEEEKQILLQEPVKANVRRLTAQDKVIFDAFCSQASEEDLDGAYVELDHWAVFGAFDEDRLACAASIYAWGDTKIMDLGVLTLDAFRGRGHARQVVRAICQYALENGYEPQYRCQLDNLASVALAKSTGLTLFAKWDTIFPDSGD
ncbi:GNAT family N-acetyltransferase [Chitinophaga flava]|uniref:GNAT family N-acetyltransferase n=1 Tax=Chitinophaga flava TaxID=2259036 RepID=UPI001B885AD9|nr:GNAT family N-acetyltransferase [Chitinophaga flava]